MWRKLWLPLLVIIAPIIHYYNFIFPVDGAYSYLINDFDTLYYAYKPYLLDLLLQGHFPLWSPGEGAGFPFYASPFTQSFYPLNLLLLPIYVLNGGYHHFDHQRFTVLGISIFSLGMCLWLRRFQLSERAIAVAVVVVALSFKLAEIMRFPNAIHAVAWYPWILLAITMMFQTERGTRRKHLQAIALFIASVICMVTAGYPYYIYYSLFLFPPYVVLLALPGNRAVLKTESGCVRSGIKALAIATCISIFITAPYLAKVYATLAQTTDRGGDSFEFSTAHYFNWEDTLGSFVFPPAAQSEGWLYFGCAALVLVALYFTWSLLTQDRLFRICVGVWMVAIFYITWGRDSALFSFLWHYLPGFSGLRTWGRLHIILVPMLGLLLALAYSNFEKILTARRFSPLTITMLVCAIIIAVQNFYFVRERYDEYWVDFFQRLTPMIPWFLMSSAIAATFFLVALLIGKYRVITSPLAQSVVALIFVLLTVADLQGIGTDIWVWKEPVPERKRSVLNVQKNLEESLVTARSKRGSVPHGARFNTGLYPNWLFKRYSDFHKRSEGEAEARSRLLGLIDGQRLFFSRHLEYPSIQAFLEEAATFHDFAKILSYNGDSLSLEVNAPESGVLSFIDNWDPDWTVRVDGVPQTIDLLFGTFKAVKLSPGNHQVVFDYRPFNNLIASPYTRILGRP